MVRARRENCKDCDGHESEVGRLSKRGFCLGCAQAHIDHQTEILHSTEGPLYVILLEQRLRGTNRSLRWLRAELKRAQAALDASTSDEAATG